MRGQSIRPTTDLQRKAILVRAKQMRTEPTPAEKVLWKNLRNFKLEGFKFRRQQPVEFFVLDFYCSVGRLAVECDGSSHDQPIDQDYDRWRDSLLTEFGIRVLRFPDKRIYEELGDVLDEIRNALEGHRQ